MAHVIFVCDTCCPKNGQPRGAGFAATLRAALAAEAELADVEVRTESCLNMCEEPMALALRAPGKVAYLFAGLDPEEDVADTLALVRLYREAPDGVIADARPAGRLRFCLKGRVPAL